MLSRRHAVMPLARDSSTRLLPWIIGVMVYLAAVILAGAMLLAGIAADWNDELSASFTVQIPPAEGDAGSDVDLQVEAAAAALRGTPGVENVLVIPIEVTAQSLKPWLGPNLSAQDLPLPRVIDVRLDPAATIDLDALAKLLGETVPGATLDNHDYWRSQIVSLVHGLEALATVLIALIAFSAVAAVIFATRSGVAVHRDVIEVLHLIGATDDFVARQFQREAFRTTFLGSLIGSVFAVLTIVIIGRLAARLDTILLPPPSLAIWQWCVLVAVPLLASLIATTTARRTVIGALRRMP